MDYHSLSFALFLGGKMTTIHQRFVASINLTSVIGSIAMLFAVVVSQAGDSPRPAQNMQQSVIPQTAVFHVAIEIDASRNKGELRPIWRFFGADEPNYAYMKDGKRLLKELGQLGP